MQYTDIDWNSLWQEAHRQKSWKKKKKQDWDKRAPGFARRNLDSSYADQFLKLMNPEPDWTVLDIGSGPGTLALPLAPLVKSVTGVDFSAAMLAELDKRAAEKQIGNLSTIQACWTDNWQERGIVAHDAAISSRSLSVLDLKAALVKLNSWALKKVFVADRVGSGPFDPDLFSALGRPFEPGPDYIFTVNLLYQMGIHPVINYIELAQSKNFSTREDALESCRWMFDDLTPAEEKSLADFVDERLRQNQDGSLRLERRTPVKWAFLSWNTT